jgi:chemotaxis protein methyltransferase CheR
MDPIARRSKSRAIAASVAAVTDVGFPRTDEQLSDSEFEYFREIARRHAGIVLADFKRSMVFRRIQKRLRSLGITRVADYRKLLDSPSGQFEIEPLINVLTTNKTEFFRESHHFDHLTSVALPKILNARKAQGNHRIRAWSAGCSTGEEPWSIAMTMASYPIGAGWDLKILATDIDTDVLKTAQAGAYRDSDLDTVPPALRSRYIDQPNIHDDRVLISKELRKLVTFKPLNLHSQWPFKGPFDTIFCRNVVIYFDRPAQRILFDRIADMLHPDGFLYCGHSESLYGISTRFRPIGRSIYQRTS